jgi:hypothetical protein
MRRPHKVKLPGPTWYLRDFNYSPDTGRPGALRISSYISNTASLMDPSPKFLEESSTPQEPVFRGHNLRRFYNMDEVMLFVDAAGATLVDERIGPRV